MDTLRDDKEHVYYDLQELTFVPGMADEDYAWVDKVLTLGHPEDWAEGIDYTDHVYNTIVHLYHTHVRQETQQLYNEHRDYQRQHEAPRPWEYTQAEQRQRVTENMMLHAQRYAFQGGLSELLNMSHYSLPGNPLQHVDETEEVPVGRWNWWGETNESE